MDEFKLKLGIQSYCFRNFKDNKKVIELLKECKLSKIELYGGAHINFSDVEQFKDVISLYGENGIDIFSIGVCLFRNNEPEERKLFEFAKLAGAKVISADFDINTVPESYRTAEKLADEYDINLAIHNHGGRHWLGSAAMLNYVFKNTTERIGLCLDTAWALDSGEDPLEMAEKFKDRLYSIHLKDFVFDKVRKPEDVIIGEGNLKLKELLIKLRENKFDGPAIIEYEGDADNPLPAIKECIESISGAVEE